MPPINVITAAVVIALFALVLRGFAPLMGRYLGDFGYYMMRGVVLVMVIGILRSGYWDFGQYLLGADWIAVRNHLGGQKFSAVFNVLMLAACRDFLKARLALIPATERGHWRWWTAWAHPGERCVIEWRRKG